MNWGPCTYWARSRKALTNCLTETIESAAISSKLFPSSPTRTTVEWDATAVEANNAPGPVDQGTEFSVRCKAGRGHLDLAYEIARCPWQCLVLEGRGRWFNGDVITFESLGDDLTRIHYVASSPSGKACSAWRHA